MDIWLRALPFLKRIVIKMSFAKGDSDCEPKSAYKESTKNITQEMYTEIQSRKSNQCCEYSPKHYKDSFLLDVSFDMTDKIISDKSKKGDSDRRVTTGE